MPRRRRTRSRARHVDGDADVEIVQTGRRPRRRTDSTSTGWIVLGTMLVAVGAIWIVAENTTSASYEAVEAIRGEATRLEEAMNDAWKAHGQRFDRAMNYDERRNQDPRHIPDVWHHKQQIELILMRVRMKCSGARDDILHGRSGAARERITDAREALEQGWTHQRLWKEGRAQ